MISLLLWGVLCQGFAISWMVWAIHKLSQTQAAILLVLVSMARIQIKEEEDQ